MPFTFTDDRQLRPVLNAIKTYEKEFHPQKLSGRERQSAYKFAEDWLTVRRQLKTVTSSMLNGIYIKHNVSPFLANHIHDNMNWAYRTMIDYKAHKEAEANGKG